MTTDTQWRQLVETLGSPEWATDPELNTYAGRRAYHDVLDEHLAEWASDRDVEEAAAFLVSHGVPAAVGRDPRAMYDHPQLRARRFYEEVDHPVVGTMSTPTWPFRFASVDRWLRTPAPTLGQHNHEILVDELGIDEDTYRDLEAAQIIGTQPRGV